MADGNMPATTRQSFGRDLWRLTRIYWISRDAPAGAALLGLAVALELGTVYANVLVARTQLQAGDMLQNKQALGFFGAIAAMLGAGLVVVLVSTYRIYVRQILEIRWRQHVTADFLHRWVGVQAYWQRELHGASIDNPDQRIAEDVRDYVASALGLSLSLLSAVTTLVSFGGLLWVVSSDWPLRIDGFELWIPGIMLWVAIAYAVGAMLLTHLVGRRLVPINNDRLRVEANFRYGLVRYRDNVEPIALAHGEARERHTLLQRFGAVMANWWQLIGAQRNLSLLTLGIGQVNNVVPLAVAAPAYFGDHLTLGGIVQIRFAYGQVSGALTWFVNAYQEIARWRANIERLARFADLMDQTVADVEGRHGIERHRLPVDALRMEALRLATPDGRTVLGPLTASAVAGDRVALIGRAGSGRTTLVRALAGIWPFGGGHIELPVASRLLVVPQRAYLPIGPLRDALTYPRDGESIPDERLVAALQAVGLDALATRLDESQHWEQRLSDAERQRFALARALVLEPHWLLLDEATSSLDDGSEQRVLALLHERLPDSAVLAVTQAAGSLGPEAQRWQLDRPAVTAAAQ